MKVAVIPARGGSKRIPRKNIREFVGKPMIAHSIECALECGLFERVIVSTDDDEIARIAREFGAEAPFRRPENISGDRSGTREVIEHSIDWLRQEGTIPAVVCCIYATAPFIRSDDLKQGLEELEARNWRYVFSATTFEFPVFRSFKMDATGGLEMLFPEHYETRSQDFPEVLHDAGQFYWARRDTWLSNAKIFAKTSTVIRIPRWRVQDIDTEEDWRRAEIVWRLLQSMESAK